MASNRDFISQVRSTHRLLSADNKINDRTILREGKNIALLLIKQQTDKRKLFSSPNLFTLIPCLQFKEAPLAECCDYTSPLTIAKSKEPLPKIAEGIYGLLIQKCSSVDNRVSFKETTPYRYSNILKLGLRNKDVYYWIYNDHLWITNPDTRAANLSAYFEEDIDNTLLYPSENCDCKPPQGYDLCQNPLDQPFRAPGYLISTITDLVSKKLLQTYHQLPQDSIPDGQDGTVKNV